PTAIVIDTLNRALLGDENKSDDMAKFIRASDVIREAFGCVVVIIHHCGIAGSRPRGHTSLSGADDAQIAIDRNPDGIVTVKIEHMKDGDASPPMACRLERLELGHDDDGDPITSCVVVPVEGIESVAKPRKLPARAEAALGPLNQSIRDKGKPLEPDRPGQGIDPHIPNQVPGVTLADWREYLLRHNLVNSDGNYREEFK